MVPFTCAAPRARRSSRLTRTAPLAALAILAGACATAGPSRPAPNPPEFEHVREVALVRWNDRRAQEQRPKDPLDALGESLAARGIVTRAVEVGPHAAAAPGLERLWSEVDRRIRAAPAAELRGIAPLPLGGDAARVVKDLAVDAVALHLQLHRSTALPRTPAPQELPPVAPTQPYGHSEPASRYRPAGALALVGRAGGLIWFDWGPRDETLDPPGPVNALEALEEAMRVLTGEPPSDERYPERHE